MASNYTKLDLKTFKTRLTENHYVNATGARRGVGKSEMTDDEKKKAYKAIDEHFGTSSAAVAKTPVAKRVAKVAAKAVAKSVTTKTATKTRGAGRGKRTVKAGSARGGKPDAEAAPAAPQELANLYTGARATRESLAGLASASELDSELDVKVAVQRGAKILQHSIDRIGELLGIAPEASAQAESDVQDDKPASGDGDLGGGDSEDE